MSLYALTFDGCVMSDEEFLNESDPDAVKEEKITSMRLIGNIYEKESDAYTASYLQTAISKAKSAGNGFYPYEIETLSAGFERVRNELVQDRRAYVVRMIYEPFKEKLIMKPVQLNFMNCYAGLEPVYESYEDAASAIKAIKEYFDYLVYANVLESDQGYSGSFVDGIWTLPDSDTDSDMTDDDLPFD